MFSCVEFSGRIVVVSVINNSIVAESVAFLGQSVADDALVGESVVNNSLAMESVADDSYIGESVVNNSLAMELIADDSFVGEAVLSNSIVV